MVQESFGGAHTERKLRTISDYLQAYAIAMKKQKLETVYFDAFAGTGEIPIREEDTLPLEAEEQYRPIIEGSAVRALELAPPLDGYIFVEKSQRKLRELESLRGRFPEYESRMTFVCGDANDALEEFCLSTNWRTTRAVVFLDPFGNQISWSTLEQIAATRAIDLWYLFPAGLGVYRQISQQGSVEPEQAQSLDRLLGTEDWRAAFISRERQSDLFENDREVTRKQADVEHITRFMINRMRGIFQGVVLDHWLPLGSRGIHMYSLLFASANPSERAKALSRKLATAVMK